MLRWQIDRIEMAYLLPYFAAAALVFLHSYQKSDRPILRQQLKWVPRVTHFTCWRRIRRSDFLYCAEKPAPLRRNTARGTPSRCDQFAIAAFRWLGRGFSKEYGTPAETIPGNKRGESELVLPNQIMFFREGKREMEE